MVPDKIITANKSFPAIQKSLIKFIFILSFIFLIACGGGGGGNATDSNNNVNIHPAGWPQTVTGGSGDSKFNSITTDSSGNVYAAGYITGTGQYSFGNGKIAQGTYTGQNIILVKYDSSGNAQWAQTATGGVNNSVFNSVAVDSSGNVYAAGYITGTGVYIFGNSKIANGTCTDRNIILVKYDTLGNAQWAQTVTGGLNNSVFNSVAVDSSGNVYTAGCFLGTGQYSFGNSITINGNYAVENVILVKYDTSGNAQWAQKATGGTSTPYFWSVAVDPTGNVYAAGYIGGIDLYSFGNSKSAQGTGSMNNIILVKYDTSGNAQWAKTVTAGSTSSTFYSITLDTGGNIYAAGNIVSTTTPQEYSFGNGVKATGGNLGAPNDVIVKYNSSGVAQWAQAMTAGTAFTNFNSIAVDPGNNIYTVGYINGNGLYSFGNNVDVKGFYNGGANVLIVQYNSSGVPQWAQSVITGPNVSEFASVAADSTGNVYAAGYIKGTEQFSFDSDSNTAGVSSGTNLVIVKY